MEREQRRLFVRDQLCEPQRSRLSRTNRLRGVLASAITIGGSPFNTLAEAEEACEVMLSHLKR